MRNTNSAPVGLLFVCTGNICRSPTAEAVFRHKLTGSGLAHRFKVDSAGTHGYHIGDPPDPRTVATALGRGVDMRDLRARQISAEDFSSFDYIFAMDSGHLRHLERLGPADKLSLYLTGGDYKDMPDPYYGGQRDFDLVFRLVEEETERLFLRLVERHGR